MNTNKHEFEKLPREADRPARQSRIDRSAPIPDALREYSKQLRTGELELHEAERYNRIPDSASDARFWERAAAWPPE